MQDDLTRLVKPPAPEIRLDPVSDPVAMRGKTGLAPMEKSGGIASPLTETLFADRSYYTEVVVASSDGIFTMRYKPIKDMKFKDGADNEVVFVFKEPV
ncbi:MAG: hypothetical protein M0Q15_16050 [Nevskia sp.]|jgi:hypothetical protein|nr:hypothetical protein [Nevskia sp.]